MAARDVLELRLYAKVLTADSAGTLCEQFYRYTDVQPADDEVASGQRADLDAALRLRCDAGSVTSTPNIDQYDYVVHDPAVTQSDFMASFSSVKSLYYTHPVMVCIAQASGLSYADALANGWLLKDSHGNLIRTGTSGGQPC
jgi:hypothetical protein